MYVIQDIIWQIYFSFTKDKQSLYEQNLKNMLHFVKYIYAIYA